MNKQEMCLALVFMSDDICNGHKLYHSISLSLCGVRSGELRIMQRMRTRLILFAQFIQALFGEDVSRIIIFMLCFAKNDVFDRIISIQDVFGLDLIEPGI